MGISINRGTPESSIFDYLIGFSIVNHPFWGTPIGNPHIGAQCYASGSQKHLGALRQHHGRHLAGRKRQGNKIPQSFSSHKFQSRTRTHSATQMELRYFDFDIQSGIHSDVLSGTLSGLCFGILFAMCSGPAMAHYTQQQALRVQAWPTAFGAGRET